MTSDQRISWRDMEQALNKKRFIKLLIIIIILDLIFLVISIILPEIDISGMFVVKNEALFYLLFIFTRIGHPLAYLFFFVVIYFNFSVKFAKQSLAIVIFALVTAILVKDIFQINRPYTNIIADEPVQVGYGFPSSYTMMAMSFWGWILYNLYRVPDHRQRVWIQISGYSMMLFIPTTRILLGVNDLEDIFGGMVIGLTLLVIFILSNTWIRLRKIPHKNVPIIGATGAIIFWVGASGILSLAFNAPISIFLSDFAIPAGLWLGLSLFHRLQPKQLKISDRKTIRWSTLLIIIGEFGVYAALYQISRLASHFFLITAIIYALLVILVLLLNNLILYLYYLYKKRNGVETAEKT